MSRYLQWIPLALISTLALPGLALAELPPKIQAAVDKFCADEKPNADAQGSPCLGIANLALYKFVSQGVQLDKAAMDRCQEICKKPGLVGNDKNPGSSTGGRITADVKLEETKPAKIEPFIMHGFSGGSGPKKGKPKTPDEKKSAEMYEQAVDLLNAQKDAEGLKILETLVKRSQKEGNKSGEANVLGLMGLAQARLKKFTESRASLEKSLATGAESGSTYHYFFMLERGSIPDQAAGDAAAEVWNTKGREKFPDDPELQVDYSIILSGKAQKARDAKDYPTAISLFEQGTRANPKSPTLAMNLGWTQCQAKQWALCEANLARAEELSPKLVETYPQITKLRAQAAKQVRVDKADALFDESMVKYKAQNFSGAAAVLEQAAALDPENGQVELYWGYMFCNMQRGALCKQHMDKAVAIDAEQAQDSNFAGMMRAANQLIARGQ